MNEFGTWLWTSGEAGGCHWVGLERHSDQCEPEAIARAFPHIFRSWTTIANQMFLDESPRKRIHRGNELEAAMASVISAHDRGEAVFFVDTPSVLYIFTKDHELYRQIWEELT